MPSHLAPDAPGALPCPAARPHAHSRGLPCPLLLDDTAVQQQVCVYRVCAPNLGPPSPAPRPLQVPPLGKGALYLRPLLMGTGPILGLGPAPSYTFTVFAAAVGAYFKARRAEGGSQGGLERAGASATGLAPPYCTGGARQLLLLSGSPSGASGCKDHMLRGAGSFVF